MFKHKLTPLLFAGCFLLILLLAVLPAQGEETASTNSGQITVPTRTPTGEAPSDTDTPPPPPPSDTPESGNTPAPPTNTPSSGGGPTATSSAVTPTSGSTVPPGAFQATAIVCGRPPTLQARNLINIRSGPGTEYPVSGSLVFGEVRHIVGRAAEIDWWAIEMPGNTVGWVANPVVNISGYTSDVPVIEPPLLNGNTATPGTPWSPTPNTACPTSTATPTVTATPSATATPNLALTEAADNQIATSRAAEITVAPSATATLEPTSTDATVAEEIQATPPDTGENPTPVATAVIVNGPDDDGSTTSWVLYAGLGLVVVGGAAYFFMSRRQ